MKLLKITLKDEGVSKFTLKSEINKEFGTFVTDVTGSEENGFLFSVVNSAKDPTAINRFKEFMIEKRGVKSFPLGLTIVQSQPRKIKPFTEKIKRLEEELEKYQQVLDRRIERDKNRVRERKLTIHQKKKEEEFNKKVDNLKKEIEDYKKLNEFPKITSEHLFAIQTLINDVNEFIAALIALRGINANESTTQNLTHNAYQFLMISSAGYNEIWSEITKDAIFIATNGTQVLYAKYDQKAFDKATQMGKDDRLFVLEKLLKWKKPYIKGNTFAIEGVKSSIQRGRIDMLVAKLFKLPNNTGLDFEYEDIFLTETQSMVGIFHKDGNIKNNDFTNLVIMTKDEVLFTKGKGSIWNRIRRTKEKGYLKYEVEAALDYLHTIEETYNVDINEKNSVAGLELLKYARDLKIDFGDEEVNRQIQSFRTPEELEEESKRQEQANEKDEKEAKQYGYPSVEEYLEAKKYSENLIPRLNVDKTKFFKTVFPELVEKSKDYNLGIYELVSYENRLKRLLENSQAKARFEREMKEKGYDDPLSFLIDRGRGVLLDEDSPLSLLKKRIIEKKKDEKETNRQVSQNALNVELINPQGTPHKSKVPTGLGHGREKIIDPDAKLEKERREKEKKEFLDFVVSNNYVDFIKKRILDDESSDLYRSFDKIEGILLEKVSRLPSHLRPKGSSTLSDILVSIIESENEEKKNYDDKLRKILGKQPDHILTRDDIREAREILKEIKEDKDRTEKEERYLERELKKQSFDQEKINKNLKEKINLLEERKSELLDTLKPLKEELNEAIRKSNSDNKSVFEKIKEIEENVIALKKMRSHLYEAIDKGFNHLTEDEKERISEARSSDFIKALSAKTKQEFIDLIDKEKTLVSKQNHYKKVYMGLIDALKNQEENLPQEKVTSLKSQIRSAYENLKDVTSSLNSIRQDISDFTKIRKETDIIDVDDELSKYDQVNDYETVSTFAIYNIDKQIRILMSKKKKLNEMLELSPETEALIRKVNQLEIAISGLENEIDDLSYNLKENRDKRKDMREKYKKENEEKFKDISKRNVERLNELRKKGENLKWSE